MNEYNFKDLYVGLKHEFDIVVTERMMSQFCEVSGDINPLHTDRSFAVEHGFRDRVSYGMLTASFYSTLAGVYLPGKHALLHGVDVKFLKPVYAGQRLKVCGEIAYLNEAYKQAEIKACIMDDEKTVVSRATLKVGIRV